MVKYETPYQPDDKFINTSNNIEKETIIERLDILLKDMYGLEENLADTASILDGQILKETEKALLTIPPKSNIDIVHNLINEIIIALNKAKTNHNRIHKSAKRIGSPPSLNGKCDNSLK